MKPGVGVLGGRFHWRRLRLGQCSQPPLGVEAGLGHHHHHNRRSLSTSRRTLLTLAIETSCDDTCVAILEKAGGAARLLFNKKVTSDNRAFGGVQPLVALWSHDANLTTLIQEALQSLPPCTEGRDAGDVASADADAVLSVPDAQGRRVRRRKPDFISVTRGPGMASPLATGLNTAKGLAVAWGIPVVGVHHMQAHALTPRLVSALELPWPAPCAGAAPVSVSVSVSADPAFPFFTLLVSGGHTLLLRSTSLTDHAVLAAAYNIAIGDMIDKCARAILPPHVVAAAPNVMYGAQLERFAFPPAEQHTAHDHDRDHGYDYEYTPPARRVDEVAPFDSGRGWKLRVPLAESRDMAYDFSALNGTVRRVVEARPGMDEEERRVLARASMKLAFEHLASRVVFALAESSGRGQGASGTPGKAPASGGDLGSSSSSSSPASATAVSVGKDSGDRTAVKTLVVSGGVASNRFLMHVLRSVLDVRGYPDVEILAPPPALCTDNAAMIAWAGAEMWEAGWQSSLNILVRNKWSMDPQGAEGGIMGLDGWVRKQTA